MEEPTALEMMEAMLFVLCDEERQTDALFVHGRGDLVEEVLFVAVDSYKRGVTPLVVINGLTANRCKELNLDYSGHEDWRRRLTYMGVRSGDILLLSPSNHTGAESENLLLMAQERGWKSFTIVATPYHQLRCFLQIVAAMEKLGIDIDVYNRTYHNIKWSVPVTKILMGGGAITGTRVDQIRGEYERILKYAERGNPSFTRHATIQEMFAYLERRNQRNRG